MVGHGWLWPKSGRPRPTMARHGWQRRAMTNQCWSDNRFRKFQKTAFRNFRILLLVAWLAMAGHGQLVQAFGSLELATAGYGPPWPAMESHGWPWLAIANGRAKVSILLQHLRNKTQLSIAVAKSAALITSSSPAHHQQRACSTSSSPESPRCNKAALGTSRQNFRGCDHFLLGHRCVPCLATPGLDCSVLQTI